MILSNTFYTVVSAVKLYPEVRFDQMASICFPLRWRLSMLILISYPYPAFEQMVGGVVGVDVAPSQLDWPACGFMIHDSLMTSHDQVQLVQSVWPKTSMDWRSLFLVRKNI